MLLVTLLISLVCAYEIDLTKSNEELFEEFKLHFNKRYSDIEDENNRKAIFIERIEGMKKFNEKNPSLKLEITKGLDKYANEFHYGVSHMNKEDKIKNLKEVQKKFNTFQQTELKRADNLPESYSSCVEKTTDVDLCGDVALDQGMCGSCYSASVAHYLQMEYTRKTYEKNKKVEYVTPSFQQFLDCTDSTNGCGGGFFDRVYISNEYVTLEEDYPYFGSADMEAKINYLVLHVENETKYPMSIKDDLLKAYYKEFQESGTTEKHVCKYRRGEEIKTPIKMSKNVEYIVTSDKSQNEKIQKMKEIINERGYFLSYMYASNQLQTDLNADNRYKDDKMKTPYVDPECVGKTTPESNHAIVVDGYGKDFFWVRNSWGTEWGIRGHYKVSTEQLCLIGDEIFYFDTEIQSSNTKGSYGMIWYEEDSSVSNSNEDENNKCSGSKATFLILSLIILILMM